MRPGRLAVVVLTLAALTAPLGALAPPETLLMDRMRSAGLHRVEPFAAPAVRGFLPGEGELRVLLFAGCGPGGDASRDAALAAVADLARTPRRHTLELVLCAAGGAGPRAARRTAEDWLTRHPRRPSRDAVLAAVHLEVGDQPGGRAVGLLLAATGAGERRLPPAWLAHAVLSGARAGAGGPGTGAAGGGRPRIGRPGNGPLGIGDLRWPFMGQLLGRHGRLRALSGAEPFLAAGLPALTLAGGGAEAGWPAILAATVRRLDALAGRPRDDDVYLALGGRVWTRRDLYWAGLAIWGALVVAGLPGPWRGAASRVRRRRGRRYLPGFGFRVLFLAALLSAPVATLALAAPACLLTLAPARWGRPAFLRLLAVVPTLVFAGYWAVALLDGRVAVWPAQPLRLALVMGAVVLAAMAIGSRGRGDAPPRAS